MGDVQRVVEALASPARREILWFTWGREASAGDLAKAVALSPATVSEHLRVLRDSGLIRVRREGTFRYYRADRSAVSAVQGRMFNERAKWERSGNPDGAPSSSHAVVERVVRVSVDVACSQERVFRSFTDPATYSAFLGVPVEIHDGRFSCTMATGLVVRGEYDLVVPNRLIVMRWDFSPTQVPLPGAQTDALLHITSTDPTSTDPTSTDPTSTDPTSTTPNSHVEVHQHAPDDAAAQRYARIWTYVLDLFAASVG